MEERRQDCPQQTKGAVVSRALERFSKSYADPRASARAESHSERTLAVPDMRYTKTGSALAERLESGTVPTYFGIRERPAWGDLAAS